MTNHQKNTRYSEVDRMPKKYWCEYCGSGISHRSRCNKMHKAQGLSWPWIPAKAGPRKLQSQGKCCHPGSNSWRYAEKIPRWAARTTRSKKMGQRIIDWSDRAYKAMEANTPISLGCATRLHRGLTGFCRGAPVEEYDKVARTSTSLKGGRQVCF